MSHRFKPFFVRLLLHLICGLLLLGFTRCFAADQAPHDVIKLYSYHMRPPLIVDVEKQQGIYFDLQRYLQQKLDAPIQLTILPRKRLNQALLDEQLDGLVVGVNSQWFDDVAEQKYLWSAAFMTDRNEVLSLRQQPIEFHDAAVLAGKTVGLSLGHIYVGIDELVTQHKIVREDAEDENQNLQKLLRGRVDAIIISRSTLDYYQQQHGVPPTLYISQRSHSVYERRLLAPKRLRPVFDKLNPFVAAMHNDPAWQAVLARYR